MTRRQAILASLSALVVARFGKPELPRLTLTFNSRGIFMVSPPVAPPLRRYTIVYCNPQHYISRCPPGPGQGSVVLSASTETLPFDQEQAEVQTYPAAGEAEADQEIAAWVERRDARD